jgi:heat shock protein HslJ
MPSFALARMDTMAHGHSMAFRVEGIELAGKPTPAQNPNREVHLVFQPGTRLCGSDGCNRIAGRYQLKGDAVTFAQMVGTQMACVNPSGTEGPLRSALKSGGPTNDCWTPPGAL